MSFSLAKIQASLASRFTAILAVVLIAALGIFAASPSLHAWIHSHEHGADHGISAKALTDSHSETHHHSPASRDDDTDGCAISIFSQGIVAVLVFFILVARFFRTPEIIFARREVSIYRAPRYWLPPLCGPPRLA